MPEQTHEYVDNILRKLETFRVDAGLTPEDVEEKLILGPGWVSSVEDKSSVPTLDVVATLLSLYGKNFSDLSEGGKSGTAKIKRCIYPESSGCDLKIHFEYGRFDAVYVLKQATVSDYNEVLSELRSGLARLNDTLAEEEDKARAIKTESVASAFVRAAKLWPHANPSDIWCFIICRAYCDQYNHPASFSRLNFEQSWKRTSGYALEKVLESHYGPFLRQQGINLLIADDARKVRLLKHMNVGGHRLEADKIDVVLSVGEGPEERMIGAVHVKASFAERRTDDVPMSHALVKGGYISPLWTMDCKSFPSSNPENLGELGKLFCGDGRDCRSAKRKDIEHDGYFSACFSYNKNTLPTPSRLQAKAVVHVCDFSNPEDAFSSFIIRERKRVKKELNL